MHIGGLDQASKTTAESCRAPFARYGHAVFAPFPWFAQSPLPTSWVENTTTSRCRDFSCSSPLLWGARKMCWNAQGVLVCHARQFMCGSACCLRPHLSHTPVHAGDIHHISVYGGLVAAGRVVACQLHRCQTCEIAHFVPILARCVIRAALALAVGMASQC